jgi:glycosyltransferase involved in cell wall biosynthesis
MVRQPARIALAYQPTGFHPRGGLQRLALNLVEHLRGSGALVQVLVARGRRHGLEGHWPDLPSCRRLARTDALLILGCDQPWAYGLALSQRLRRPRMAVHWLPSFHDPGTVAHPLRARLAGTTLKLMQRLGVHIHAQTDHERSLLDAGACHLSSHALGAELRQRLRHATAPHPEDDRPVDLLFLGRPTAQKGWPRFLRLAARSGLRCTAVVPSLQEEQGAAAAAAGVTIVRDPDDATLLDLLRQARVVTIPADYESFGLAQLESLSQGCLVPVLGHWPLWQGFPELQWQAWNEQQLVNGCRALCRNNEERRRLVALQLAYLHAHPIQSAPWLPGVVTERCDD